MPLTQIFLQTPIWNSYLGAKVVRVGCLPVLYFVTLKIREENKCR